MVESKAELLGFTYDFDRKQYILQIGVDSTGEFLQTAYENLKGKLCDLVLKIHRKKRSLDANAYYWEMLGKLASKLNVSNTRMHNLLLRSYGTLELIDGQNVYVDIPFTDDADAKALESETFHIKPTDARPRIRFSADGKSADLVKEYVMIKGSRDYDTKEMSVLINGLLNECHDQGISTISDEEAERMIKAYGQRTNTN